MKILNQWSTEREGNDSWLKYNLSIIQEWDDVNLQLENHSGWGGEIRKSRSFHLDPHEITDEMINRICDYVSDYSELSDYDSMLNTVADAIHNVGLDRGNLWFELEDQLRSRIKVEKEEDSNVS